MSGGFTYPLYVGIIVGIIVFILNCGERQVRIRIENKVAWEAIAAEVSLCSELADRYVSDKVISPSYRLPTNAYDSVFPKLLANNGITKSEIPCLQIFYTEARSVNRGLDNAAAYIHAGKTEEEAQKLLGMEYDRTGSRAKRLTSANGELSKPVQILLKKRGVGQ